MQPTRCGSIGDVYQDIAVYCTRQGRGIRFCVGRVVKQELGGDNDFFSHRFIAFIPGVRQRVVPSKPAIRFYNTFFGILNRQYTSASLAAFWFGDLSMFVVDRVILVAMLSWTGSGDGPRNHAYVAPRLDLPCVVSELGIQSPDAQLRTRRICRVGATHRDRSWAWELVGCTHRTKAPRLAGGLLLG